VGNGLSGQVVLRGEPVVVRDVRCDPRYRNRELAEAEGLLSFLAVPLRVRDRVIGVFNCYLGSAHDFDKREIELFSTLANQTALALENANLAMNAMLVREMHHRVKNNLQMVAMLLRLQLRGGREVSAREVLQQTISRILSIAAVHEALSQEGFKWIGLKGLLQQAAVVATQNSVHPNQDIRVVIEGRDVRLPSQPATSLALAVNELIQNALEHGFTDRASGVVVVRLDEEAEHVVLAVADDGSGLPEAFDKADSLGLQIVQTLVTEDLQGEFQLGWAPGGGGTLATVRVAKIRLGLDGGLNVGAGRG
jgi:two-component sensor histidine kinase